MNTKHDSDEDEARKVRGEIDLDEWMFPASDAANRVKVLKQLVADAQKTIAHADRRSDEWRQADLRVRAAIRAMMTGTSELSKPEIHVAMGRALEVAPRLLAGDTDEEFYALDKLTTAAEELGLDRSVLLDALDEKQRREIVVGHVRNILAKLLEKGLPKERLSDEVIAAALHWYPKEGRKKWSALHALGTAIGCGGYPSDETFRVQFSTAQKKL